MKNIYLTIDDAPSCHMDKKIDFLKGHDIPAVFFCRGEFILHHKDKVIKAIKNGFLIGNHSYSHPFFSEISIESCFEEIKKTEKLIDECYRLSGEKRRSKVIRLPFGDRGAGKWAKKAENKEEELKVLKLQQFLEEEGFVPCDYKKLNDGFIDAFWTWDTRDYKKKLIEEPKLYLKELESYFQNSKRDEEIMLIHDFDHNHHLFEIAMKFLLDKKVGFCCISSLK